MIIELSTEQVQILKMHVGFVIEDIEQDEEDRTEEVIVLIQILKKLNDGGKE